MSWSYRWERKQNETSVVWNIILLLFLFYFNNNKNRYQKLYDEAQKGFKIGSPETIHGSLIALGELLKNTGDFVTSKFKEICDAMLKYREHKDRHVRRAGMFILFYLFLVKNIFILLLFCLFYFSFLIWNVVVTLLPRLGMHSPELFVHNYLNTSTLYLISILQRNQNERGVAFISLGEIAVAVGGSIFFFLYIFFIILNCIY